MTSIAVLLLYVGAVGPVAWLLKEDRLPVPESFAMAVYAPLFWTSERNETFRDAVNWYVHRFV